MKWVFQTKESCTSVRMRLALGIIMFSYGAQSMLDDLTKPLNETERWGMKR